MKWKINEDNTLPRVSKSLSGIADAKSQLWGQKLILGTKEEEVVGEGWADPDEVGSGFAGACASAEPAPSSQTTPHHPILPKVQVWKELALPLLLGRA